MSATIQPDLLLFKVALISLALGISACSPLFKPHHPIPEGMQTMEDIYDQHHAAESRLWQPPHPMPDGASHLAGYTREVYNELSVRFPRLPNPTIVMYVFPHLATDGAPIPGYSTMFQLYEKVEYALPEEVTSQ